MPVPSNVPPPSSARSALEPSSVPSGDPAPRGSAPIPPSSRPREVLALGVLRPLLPFALLVAVTMLLARAIVPSLRGVVVGISQWVELGDTAAGALSQLVAFASSVLLGAMLVQLAQSGAPRVLRYPLVVAGVLAVLATSGAAAIDRPPPSLLVTVAVAASSAAVIAGIDALRQPTGGFVGLVWIFGGVGAWLRVGSAQLLELAIDRAAQPELAHSAAQVASHLATASFGVILLAQLVGMAYIARRGSFVVSPQVIVALGVVLAATKLLSTPPTEHSAAWLVLRGAVERLSPRPWPAVPQALVWAQALLAPTLALLALTVRRDVPALVGALSLALLVPGTADVPMLGLSLLVSSAALALVVRDARGVWASLERRAAKG